MPEKRLRFSKSLIELILSGQKWTTWRIGDEKNIVAGDELSLCSADGREFAKALVISVKETSFGKLSDDDKNGHEKFSSDDEMYSTYSKYYRVNVLPETKVKVIKFSLPIKSVDGLLILDKSAGLTSRAVVEQVKKLLDVKSAGHVGTLDPNATGVLPILIGRATRVAPALERLDKEYVAVVHLHKDVSDDELNSELMKFVGVIKQKPPVHSAVARRERERQIYSIGVLGRAGENGKDVKMHVICEAGTYIRKLASDLGLEIGGAHLKELRRVRAGPFSENEAHTFEELKKAFESGDVDTVRKIIFPIEKAVDFLPKFEIGSDQTKDVFNGTPLRKVNVEAHGNDLVAIMCDKKLIALGRKKSSDLKIVRVIAKIAEIA